jgi:hypothetical protein
MFFLRPAHRLRQFLESVNAIFPGTPSRIANTWDAQTPGMRKHLGHAIAFVKYAG